MVICQSMDAHICQGLRHTVHIVAHNIEPIHVLNGRHVGLGDCETHRICESLTKSPRGNLDTWGRATMYLMHISPNNSCRLLTNGVRVLCVHVPGVQVSSCLAGWMDMGEQAVRSYGSKVRQSL